LYIARPIIASPQVRLVVLASISLALGLVVYLVAREAGSTRFLPTALHIGLTDITPVQGFFGNLPSFFHVYAFILYSAAVVEPNRKNILLICITWLCIETILEILQSPSVLRNGMMRDVLGTGYYDPLDILSLTLGTIAAYISVQLITKRSQSTYK